MPHSIAEIARLTGLEAEGDLALEILRPAEPALASEGDLAMAMSPKYAEALSQGAARAAVLWPGADWQALGLSAALFAPRARVALAGVNALYAPQPDIAPGIHPAAVVDPAARLGEGVDIGPFAVIGAGAEIGAGSRIASHVSIGRDVRLGDGALVLEGARIAHGVRIGARAMIHPNVVIGADGFSFSTPEPGAAEAARGRAAEAHETVAFRRIASLGTVEIGDDVEIGAGACIDRATLSATRIGSGTKIDNLVQIGHNCQIGTLCLICGHVGLAGSVQVGDRVVLGGKVGVSDNLKIGADSVVAGGSLVGANIPPKSVMLGVPAVPREEAYRQIMALKRLPRVMDEVRALKARFGL